MNTHTGPITPDSLASATRYQTVVTTAVDVLISEGPSSAYAYAAGLHPLEALVATAAVESAQRAACANA